MVDPATGVAIGSIALEIENRAQNIITRHVKYITDFKENVVDFRSYLELFEARIEDINEFVDSCRRNLQEPGKEVEVFLRQCTEFKVEYASDLEKLKGLNLERKENCCSRYKLSKKAIELEGRMMNLTRGFNYNPPMVSKPRPKAVQKISTMYVGFNSTEKVKADIMNAIICADTSVIGMHGMGGVGKTTLMERINDDLLTDYSHRFTYVIMVTVSATPNIFELQDKIAKRVGYKDLKNEQDIKDRAGLLKERLKKEKSILIILDDVWERLDLNEVGIPSGNGENNCCKIILTTRNANVCKQMDAASIIPMACLNFDESWKLFEEKSGAITTESIRKIAKDVCKKCAGLPLAISIVASTLKNEDNEFRWIDFLSKLEKPDPTIDLVDMENKVYIPLKQSYDYLFFKKSRYDDRDYNELQLCFLFCSLFPEDHEIDLIDLMYYGIGEGFIICDGGESSSLICTQTLIHKLKTCGLLLEVERGEMFVKMHDVVREVAIFIAKNEKKFDFYTNFKGLTKWPEGGDSETRKRISLMGNSIQHVVNHQKFDGKEMKSLLLNNNRDLKTIADNFFEEMEDLLVLDLRCTNLKSLPTSIQNLTKLRVLMVSPSSSFDKGMHSVNLQHLFSMENLSVLILRNSRIRELTKEFGKLELLKVLDFTDTTIDIIWPNVLSKLMKLEELRLRGSFNKWNGCSVDGKSFVSFFELGSLKHLYALEVEVANDQGILSKSAPDNFLQSFAGRGKKKHAFFIINFAFSEFDDVDMSPKGCALKRKLQCDDDDMFPKGCTLSLKGKLQFPKWILLLLKETESLSMEECKIFQRQILQNSENTEDYGVSKNLRRLHISRCENFEDVVLLKSHALKFFVNLERLNISLCKLQRVIEYYSPNSGDDIVILPKITRIHLGGLDELENIFAITPTVMPNGSFQRLKTITIGHCSKLKLIFPWNVAVCLVHLSSLEIGECSELEAIVGKAESDYDQVVLFPKLEKMQLSFLPNLESLWQEQSEKGLEMEWPSLEYMSVFECDKLNRLFWGHQSAPSLKLILMSEECFEKMIWEDDQAASRFKSLRGFI